MMTESEKAELKKVKAMPAAAARKKTTAKRKTAAKRKKTAKRKPGGCG